ncbi:MAG TPA: MBL fold metallo-hydrolase, partial [Chloroflexota bacterium]|nr:MBL fold metallo-hydrolase [Chloroflexota bacterium]
TWQDGDVVELGAYTFEVIATPGHAPDSIALYQPETRLLISADALHEGDCGILNTAVHGDHILDEAINTVNKLLQYDIALALPGHGGVMTDPAASLNALARRLAEFKTYPEKMALHLCRRVTMTAVLLAQPIGRQQFIEEALARPWPHDYAPRANCPDPAQLLHSLLDDFIQRGLLREQDGRLVSTVNR